MSVGGRIFRIGAGIHDYDEHGEKAGGRGGGPGHSFQSDSPGIPTDPLPHPEGHLDALGPNGLQVCGLFWPFLWH